MKDRFYNGFISGVIGGITPFIFNFSSLALEFTTLTWKDFLGLFVIGKIPKTILEIAFFIGMQYAFLGILGAIFAIIIPHISSKHLIFKGALYGAGMWFIFLSIPYLLQLPMLQEIPFKTAISNLIGSSLWGITLALILKKVDKKVSN
ncbi:hypothetical protein [Sporohalobacter salinus]|uniref:hypothetical protein n=1 Tax=Sporohalobacter salinus TaxID=1494606 RepID=UPI001960CDA3|nr:hypothetical protein [Sporohalobacter salinus]MBM7624237.1 putative membrane protein YagU involved in acid resistance [Sporohalobacter salinus]